MAEFLIRLRFYACPSSYQQVRLMKFQYKYAKGNAKHELFKDSRECNSTPEFMF